MHCTDWLLFVNKGILAGATCITHVRRQLCIKHRRDDVIREIGEDAFDYGLLIGHEDPHRLIRDETADIYVTFPHRSIQEFLGALYFVWMLNQGKEIQSVSGINSDKLIFLTNTLFLQFCIWFLCDDQKYFTFGNKQNVRQHLTHFTVNLLNKGELDMKRIERDYPALDISTGSYYAKDKLRVSFLGDILAKCNKASSLILSHHHTLNQFLEFIKSNLKSLTFIKHEKATCSVSFFKSTEMVIEAWYNTLDKLCVILKHYNKVMNDPVVHLYLCKPTSFVYSAKRSSFQNVRTLHLSCLDKDCKEGKEFLRVGSDLTELHFNVIKTEIIMNQVINKLSGGNYQSLNHLSFVRCSHIEGKLSVLFESVQRNLKYLNLLHTPLSEKDLEFLCLACNGSEKTLPNLTSLCLSIPDASNTSRDTFWTKFVLLPWLKLKQLYVYYEDECSTDGLSRAIRDHKLPNLTCLRIKMFRTGPKMSQKEALGMDQLTSLQSVYLDDYTRGEFQIEHNLVLRELSIPCRDNLMEFLSFLSVPGFPNLTTLALSNCVLKSEHLENLAQAKVKGGLPVIKNLDISLNKSWINKLSLHVFQCLFDESCKWSELLSFDISGMFERTEDDRVVEYMNEIPVVSKGYLSSLQKLGINRFESRNVHWNCLEKVFLTECKGDALDNIVDSVRSKFLPALRILCVTDFRGHNAEIVLALSELGVSCHETRIPSGNEFSRARCYCETQMN